MAVKGIEAELIEATGRKPKSKEKRQSFLKDLVADVNKLDEDSWENLSQEAQSWANNANTANTAGETLPEFDDTGTDTESAEEETAEETESEPTKEDTKMGKTKKAGKTAKSVKSAKPAKAPKATKPEKTAKPRAKGNGALGATPEWRKVLSDVAKKGKEGVDGGGMEKLCEKHGVRPYFARFVRGGYLQRVGRGVYAITSAGEKFLAEKD